MANQVVLEQKADPFKNLNPVLNPILDGLTNFGNNFSVVAGTLIEFMTATKIFLRAIRNPLAGPLLSTIDALIEVLEDLRDIGVGNTSVWPWEHGTYPPNIDTSKLDSAISSLVAILQGVDPKLYQFDDDGNIVKSKNGSKLITPDQELLDSKISEIKKDKVYENLLALRNFFHPETWSGQKSDDPDLSDTFKKLVDNVRQNYIVKELTPKQAVDKVVKSLRSSSPDGSRPTGTGEYQAYVLMFALPTINGVLQIVQSFVDYFGSVLGDPLVKEYAGDSSGTNDEKTQEINLGFPLKKTEFQGVGANESFLNIDDLKPRLVSNGSYDKDGFIIVKSPETTHPYSGFENYEIDRNPDEELSIPVFEKGDTIGQSSPGGGYQIFSAEVVEHYPIEIENGIVVQNKIKVKNVRGALKKSSGTNSAPPVRLLVRSQNDPSIRDWPIFKSTKETEKIPEIKNTFYATVSDGSADLTDIIPNDVVGAQIRATINRSTSNPNDATWKTEIDKILQNDGSFKAKVIRSYEQFFRSLSKGMIVRHEFLQPLSASNQLPELYNKSAFTNSDFKFNYGKLLDLVPSVGATFHIAEISFDDTPETNFSKITRKTFLDFDPEKPEKIIGIKKIKIVLGFKNFDGTYNTKPWLEDLIEVPGTKVFSFQTKIAGVPITPLRLFATEKDLVPTWKFLRIQDLFPIYGDVLGKAVTKVEEFKAQVEGLIKDIDDLIDFLERQIDALVKLNDSIQQLIALFSQGLNGAGIYSGAFSGKGVNDFANKLQTMKLKKSSEASKLKEISLETVEIDVEVTDPFTGLPKTEKQKTLRPIAKEVDDNIPGDSQPRSLSSFDQLKYSGMIVFYAQGPDTEKFQSFMDNFSGLRALASGLLANAFGAGDSIIDKLRPKVFEVQGQNENEEFTNLEKLGSIDNSGIIRIVFTNEGHTLTQAEKDAVEEQMERNVEFFPKIEKPSASFSAFGDNDTVNTSGDPIVLFQGNYDPDANADEQFSDSVFFELEQQPKFSFSGGGQDRGFFNIDIKSKIPLPRSNTRYKLLIKQSIVNTEGLPAFRFLFDVGFTINPIRVESGSLV